MSDLRSRAIRLAASLPKGDPTRRKLLEAAEKVSGGKTARGPKEATYWIVPKSVRNISVKDYEDDNLGTSGKNGKLVLAGELHIKPKGAIWDVTFPFSGVFELAEHGPSGTLSFSPARRTPVLDLVTMATLDYSVESEIIKMLGRVEFVPYDEQRLRSAAIHLAASLPSGSDERRALLSALQTKQADAQNDARWAADEINRVLSMLRDVADVLEGRDMGPSLADAYSDVAGLVKNIRQSSRWLSRGMNSLRRLG